MAYRYIGFLAIWDRDCLFLILALLVESVG